MMDTSFSYVKRQKWVTCLDVIGSSSSALLTKIPSHSCSSVACTVSNPKGSFLELLKRRGNFNPCQSPCSHLHCRYWALDHGLVLPTCFLPLLTQLLSFSFPRFVLQSPVSFLLLFCPRLGHGGNEEAKFRYQQLLVNQWQGSCKIAPCTVNYKKWVFWLCVCWVCLGFFNPSPSSIYQLINFKCKGDPINLNFEGQSLIWSTHSISL